MFDVFYSGKKPNLFVHEREAESIEHAQQLSRTRYFWWVHYLVDLSDWDFLWQPVPWQSNQRHAWKDQFQYDSGVYLVPKEGYTDTNYHSEHQIRRVPDVNFWHVPEWIDKSSINYRWTPNPADPPYIYEFPVEWGWDNIGGPEYRVPGAIERKFVDDFVARTASDPLSWCVNYDITFPEELYRWRPNPMDPPYDYVFGNQWYSAEVMPTVEYRVPGATSKKYMSDLKAELPERHSNHWHTLADCEWDYSWVPDPGEPPYIYVFGNQWWPAEKMPTVEYHVEGATERKYMDMPARILADKTNWQVPECVDPLSIDYSWRPDPGDPAYIYEFATQWQPNGGARYVVPGATEVKYVEIQHRRLPDKNPWKLLEAVAKFDYSWHPDNTAEPYNYVFGNQHWPGEIMPTIMYCMPGATQETFVENPVAELWGCMGNWEFCEDIDDSKWDWTWVPNPKDPPYIYVFGNQWNPPEHKASIKYHVEGATEIKYMEARTTRLPNYGNQWRVHINVEKFDYSWEPNPFDPPMDYVFGNQWNPAVLEPTVVYHVEGATETKYIDEIIATVAQDKTKWELLDEIQEFDYSWRPNPTDPPYIYVFGNQWLTPEQRPAIQYRVPTATQIKYMDAPKAKRRGNPEKFTKHYDNIEFDYSWEPDPGDPPYIYVFGNQWHAAEIMPTVTYTVPGATERKYVDHPRAQLLDDMMYWCNQSEHRYHFDYSWKPDPGDPPMIYMFGNQHWPAEKMPTVCWMHPDITEQSPVKYMDEPRATLLENKTLWNIPFGIDQTDIDFSWVPDPGEPPYIYQFATQWQKTGGAQYVVPTATEIKYLEWIKTKTVDKIAPIFEIDHLDGNAGKIPDVVKRIRYFDNYRDTLIRLAKSLVGQYEHVWVCSSICDYSDFDFTWHPEQWQQTMLHVFASNEQKFGDTFYMHVPTFAERAEKKALLEWYSVNYVPRISVPRYRLPVIEHTGDSQVDVVKTTDWPGPLALFTTTGLPITIPALPLWRQEVKTIMPLSAGASAVIVPKIAKADIKTQLYDYPYIDKTQSNRHSDQPLDIVFISNGENEADFLYQWLVDSVGGNNFSDGEYRIRRVDGVKGRVAAYQAAANASRTPWFFAVFAKLQVSKEFPWTWQPDRMQQAKHYIFHARNPINDLVYGHQAMIAYNKKLVLENEGVGLDFTLDQPHEVVPIVSGQANYYTSDWMCWRTAFREVIKLQASLPDVENEYRLNQWLTVDKGAGQWSSKGAEDAVEFYEAVNGDPIELKKSYEWEWLASYAFMKRGSF